MMVCDACGVGLVEHSCVVNGGEGSLDLCGECSRAVLSQLFMEFVSGWKPIERKEAVEDDEA